jgi:hypothetical protein
MGEGHWTESHPLTASKDVMPLPRLAPGTLRWWIVGVLGVGAMVAVVIWYGLAANVGAVVPEVTAYRVVSDSQLEVDYRLTRPADRAVTCTITGLDARKGIVGTVTDEVPAGESRVQRSVEIRTAQRAVTGVVDSCVRH